MPGGSSLTPWEWTDVRQRAATLLAEDHLTHDEIASELGISRQSLWLWKKSPEFALRIEELAREMGEVAARHAITKKSRRLASMTKRWEKLHQIIDERSSVPYMHDVPGGKTGLLVRQLKSIGTGENSQVVEEYTLDAALLREIRELEKRAAEEVGELPDENKDDGTTDIDLEARRRALIDLCRAALERAAAGNGGAALPWDGQGQSSSSDGMDTVQG